MFHVLLIYTIDEIYDSLEAFKWLMLEKFENTKAVSRRSMGNTMAKRKRTKGQTMIYKTLHRKP